MIHPFEQAVKRLVKFSLLTDKEERQAEEFFLFVEKNVKPETEYIKFMRSFNIITKKKYTTDLETRRLFYALESVYTLEDREEALRNSLKDPWVKDRLSWLTPAKILTRENIAKYINYTPTINNSNSQDNEEIKRSYADVQDI